MTRDEHDRLRDVKDAITAIHEHLAGAGPGSAQKDGALLHDALLFQFVIIGEAVKHLRSETRDSVPEIPWTNIAGLRDVIAQEYFHIDIERILEIVSRDLPPLQRAIDRLLER